MDESDESLLSNLPFHAPAPPSRDLENFAALASKKTTPVVNFRKITKALKTEGYTPIPPLKRPNGSIALDDAEVAECIADSIETQFSHVSPPHDIAHINSIEEEVLQKNSLEPKDDLTPVSLSEVQTLVKSISTRKAPGLDGVRGGGNRHPQARETSRPPASYRPISHLSGLAKLFERVLKNHLSNHLFGKGLIIDEQFDFHPAHSCPQQVLRLVWHAGLVYKLYSLQVPDRLILTIQNFLSNRHFTFRHERTHWTRRLIRAGVPQGSALSPLLYSAYTNDILRPTSGVQLALFADDTALFFKSRTRRFIFRHLPRAIDELDQWFWKWRIKDASKRFFDIAGSHPNALFARRSTINRRLPPT
ncbi:Probable RNA-directed DNA polymerase from transposon BS [Eumeta japonica]|uniref:Probable RNA-directed DNA polymerase from transposon BS n=1 Tax=Eumeta variegata TaxID=151549 RepID=A0A4C1W2X2_EUMVA|nr:Probable RNA-directed DNA polymerase from transposon BS [Eumeta japonica]